MRKGPAFRKYPKGCYYIGDVVEGDKWTGKGIVFCENGDVFEGEWKDDLKVYGTYKWVCGDLYTGEWKEGNKHGKGSYYWASGTYYIGEWENDKKHGKGRKVSKETIYEGDFKNDNKEGFGVLTWDDGTVYEGEFKDDEKCGDGTMTWTAGFKFIGTAILVLSSVIRSLLRNLAP